MNICLNICGFSRFAWGSIKHYYQTKIGDQIMNIIWFDIRVYKINAANQIPIEAL